MQTINFEPGDITTKNCSNCRFGYDGMCTKINECVTSSLDQSPSHWMEMTAAQKLEKEKSNIKTDKKLVGDIINGYSYIDTDIAYKKEYLNRIYGAINFSELYPKQLFQLPITNYNKMFKKENKKMDIKLYECGTFVGGVVKKPQDLIKNVIFSGPCTIVQWSDGDKTIVRCENEDFDKEKGLAMAIVKKLFGTNESKSNYNAIFKKWIQEEEVPEFLNKKMNVSEDKKYHTVEDAMYMSIKQYANMTGMSKSTIIRHINKGKIFGAKKDKTGKWLIPIPIVEV